MLQQAFHEADAKLANRAGSWWNAVAGPTAALLASMKRLGWVMLSAREVIDDNGMTWQFARDSPAAIVRACQKAVRRWRIQRIGDHLPGLIPDDFDVEPTDCRQVCKLIDFSFVLAPLLNARGSGAKSTEQWDPTWRAGLASAICGGQWTQARKAAVPDWGIEDSRCQLCLAHAGTLEHRHSCPATMPVGGWPAPPSGAKHALDKLSPARLKLLLTRGMLVLKVPVSMPKLEGSFTWLVQPDKNNPNLKHAVWYFDGSMLNGRWQELRATGFGVVVVSSAGDLLGFGRGSPPHWCATAAAAEAWALQVVIGQCPLPPQMRTDCQALLTTLSAGTQRATAADKQLARIWRTIAASVGCCLVDVASSGVLVWMPAHLTTASVGKVQLSNGNYLSMTDWRANRLVDALAKMSALDAQCLPACIELVRAATIAVKHAAMQLGRVTHAANHHVIHEQDEQGIIVQKVLRDAVQCAQPRKRKCPNVANLADAPKAEDSAGVPARAIGELPPPLKAPRTAKRTTPGRECSNAAVEIAALQRRVNDIGSTLAPDVGRPSAADRIAALRSRLCSKPGWL